MPQDMQQDKPQAMQRFDILKTAGLIDEAVYRAITAVRQQFVQWQIDCETAQVEMLLTHLAMALMRIQKGEPQTIGLDNEIWQEVTASECYPELLAYHQRILSLIAIELPHLLISAQEESYLIANLYSLSLEQQHIFNLNLHKNED
jgi:hypothetical protein